LLALHFLALPSPDRYLRFAAPATAAFVGRYVDGIDFDRDAVLAVEAAAIGDDGRRVLAGVVHAAYPGAAAEVGVSVLPAYRGRGVASALVERAVAHARERGIRRLSMHLLAFNTPMLRIARKLGMTFAGDSVHLCARLDLSPRPRFGSLAAERASDDPALADDAWNLYHAARAHRAHAFAEIVAALAESIGEIARRARARWRRQQRASSTRAALAGLDDRTLRDLGLHRSEIGSVAAEVAGETARERLLSTLDIVR
jgi:RimJ/RimL family protein N-acetyltransferase